MIISPTRGIIATPVASRVLQIVKIEKVDRKESYVRWNGPISFCCVTPATHLSCILEASMGGCES